MARTSPLELEVLSIRYSVELGSERHAKLDSYGYADRIHPLLMAAGVHANSIEHSGASYNHRVSFMVSTQADGERVSQLLAVLSAPDMEGSKQLQNFNDTAWEIASRNPGAWSQRVLDAVKLDPVSKPPQNASEAAYLSRLAARPLSGEKALVDFNGSLLECFPNWKDDAPALAEIAQLQAAILAGGHMSVHGDDPLLLRVLRDIEGGSCEWPALCVNLIDDGLVMVHTSLNLLQEEGLMVDREALRRVAADSAFAAYDFGDGFTVADTGGWNHTTGENEWHQVVFVTAHDQSSSGPTVPFVFTASFHEGSPLLDDAYANDANGNLIGNRGDMALAASVVAPDATVAVCQQPHGHADVHGARKDSMPTP